MNEATQAARTASIAEAVGRSLVEDFGGILRCNTCGRTETISVDQGGDYMSVGWPTCHGHTMTWWTARQVAAGEVPALS